MFTRNVFSIIRSPLRLKMLSLVPNNNAVVAAQQRQQYQRFMIYDHEHWRKYYVNWFSVLSESVSMSTVTVTIEKIKYKCICIKSVWILWTITTTPHVHTIFSHLTWNHILLCNVIIWSIMCEIAIKGLCKNQRYSAQNHRYLPSPLSSTSTSYPTIYSLLYVIMMDTGNWKYFCIKQCVWKCVVYPTYGYFHRIIFKQCVCGVWFNWRYQNIFFLYSHLLKYANIENFLK